jgi:hypothetical protein
VTTPDATLPTPVSTLAVIAETLCCSSAVAVCSAASSWLCARLSGGPDSHCWIAWMPVVALAVISETLPTTDVVMRVTSPASTTMPASTTVAAASACGKPWLRSHAVGGQSAVARMTASSVGITTDHSAPISSQTSTAPSATSTSRKLHLAVHVMPSPIAVPRPRWGASLVVTALSSAPPAPGIPAPRLPDTVPGCPPDPRSTT